MMMYIKSSLALLGLLFQACLFFDNAAASSARMLTIGDDEVLAANNTTSSTTESRIVGGELAPRDAYPWFARIVRFGNHPVCGGTLIAKEYVLTAAHCVRRADPSKLGVQIGAVCPTTTSNNCGQPMQYIKVESKQIHPSYNQGTVNNDFALLKLVSRANADPVPIDRGNVVDNYSSNKRGLYAIGFGNTQNGGSPATELMHVELAFVPRNTCRSKYGHHAITDSMMCAADPGQDACQGDSGGPLYDKANNALVGVVSWGDDCAHPDKPGVYAQVSSEFDWIKSNTCGLSNHSNPQPDYCSNTPSAPTAPTPTAPSPTTVSIPSIALKKCKNTRKYRFAVSVTKGIHNSSTNVAVYRRDSAGNFSRRVFYRHKFIPSNPFVRPYIFFRNKCIKKDGCYKIVGNDSNGDASFQGFFDGVAVAKVDANGFESEPFGNC